MRIKRYLFIYFRLLSQHLKAILEYQADFLIAMFAAMLTQVLGFIFIWVVYLRIPDIQGWTFWEVAFIYAMMFFTTGIGQLFFEGTWRIGALINRGEFDRVLLRPVSPIVQVLGSAVGMNGLGNILIGGVMIIQALRHVDMVWTWEKTLMCLLLLLCAVAIRVSVFLASNCITFWTHAPGSAFANMISNLSEFSRYPITIYSSVIQVFFSTLIPYAFISFFPAAYLFDKGDWAYIGLFTPIVAIYSALVSRWIFYKGLNKYESVGN
jgi:ABC-2 type transport system permease protein